MSPDQVPGYLSTFLMIFLQVEPAVKERVQEEWQEGHVQAAAVVYMPVALGVVGRAHSGLAWLIAARQYKHQRHNSSHDGTMAAGGRRDMRVRYGRAQGGRALRCALDAPREYARALAGVKSYHANLADYHANLADCHAYLTDRMTTRVTLRRSGGARAATASLRAVCYSTRTETRRARLG